MKRFRFALLFIPLLLTACGLSEQQKADYTAVQSSGVSSAIYDKMVHGDALSLYDIKSLARAHVRDSIVLRYLRDHGTVYFLTSQDVTDLQKAGVSQSIIDYMLQTAQMYGPAGPYYPYPVVGIGVGYGPYWGPGPCWGPFWGGPYHHHH
jgi:hypothetical protein